MLETWQLVLSKLSFKDKAEVHCFNKIFTTGTVRSFITTDITSIENYFPKSG